MKMKRVDFTITELNDYDLRKISEFTGLAKSDIVRRAIEEYVHRHYLNYQAKIKEKEL